VTRPQPGQHWLDRGAGRRLFVAVPLGEAAQAAVGRLMADLGRAPGTARGPGGAPARGAGRDTGRWSRPRWVRAESLHITLRFVGLTPDEAIPDLAAAVDEAAAGVAAFPCRLEAAGSFPPGPRPRVLWIGTGEGSAGLGALAGRLEDALAARGWPRDERGFTPHLTIARTDGVAVGGAIADDLRRAVTGLDAAWTADRVVLFESITGGGPARYVSLHEALLEPSLVAALAPDAPTG
jgi:RNA 2',3'-cyclic 3'-phosphodiesterase